MSDLKEQVAGIANGKNATGGIYVLFIGAALGNILPTPSDAAYFYLQTKLRDKWKSGKITGKKYWGLNTFYYYAVPCVWWIFLGSIIVMIKGDAHKKIKLAAALVGGGVVLGTVLKQIQRDDEQLNKEDEEKLKLLKEHPEVMKILNRPEYDNIASQFKNVTGEKLKKQHDELISQLNSEDI